VSNFLIVRKPKLDIVRLSHVTVYERSRRDVKPPADVNVRPGICTIISSDHTSKRMFNWEQMLIIAMVSS